MRLCRLFGATLVFTFISSPLHAEWIKLTTSHFEMYTTNPRAKALEALDRFEQARAFFDDNSKSATVTEEPIRIIAFDSERDFRPYSPNPGAVAFYERGDRRDYIVMRDLGPTAYSVAIHEYTHLYLEHRNLHLPLWLNEGLADVYSTLQIRDGQLIIGAPPPGRLQALTSAPLLELDILTGVDQQSPYYRQPALMRQFYSESWALAHMLLLGEQYRDGFEQLLQLLDTGASTEGSFGVVYGKTLSEVAADLQQYIRAPLPFTSFDAHVSKREIPELSSSADGEVEATLAELLSMQTGNAEEAQERLSGLAAESPDNPEVQKSLGYLAWRQGKVDEAKQHFKKALQQGSTDATMIFQYASLLHNSGAPASQVMPLLQRAVELKPDLYDAQFSLGMEAANEGQCGVALSALSAIPTITADHAFPLYAVLTYCNEKLGHAAEARHWGELAEQYAPDSNKRAMIESWMIR